MTNFQTFLRNQNQEKIWNSTDTKDPTAPQICRYATSLNVSVLKQPLKQYVCNNTF